MSYELARQIHELPSLPTVVHRLVDTLEDPKSSAEDVEEILSVDQSTTARMLAVANSPYYGMHHAITSVSRAVVVLGLDEVRSIALGSALSSILMSAGFMHKAAATRLWGHALAVQEASLLVAKAAGTVRSDLARTAGLLHDLGWVVILSLEPDKWDRLEKAVTGRKYSISQAEKLVGAAHQSAGAALAAHWDMPPALAEVMASHHNPDPKSTHYILCRVVQLADYLACSLGMGPLAGHESPAPAALAAKELACEACDLLGLRDDLKIRIEQRQELWGQLGLSQPSEKREV